MYLNTTYPQAALYRHMYSKGHLSFRDTCPDSYICLPVLCVLCLAVYLAAVCTMQCWAASNAHYAVLGSFQHALCSFSSIIHRICTFLWPFLSKLYSIAIYLGHQMNTFFYTIKTLKYHNFLNIYPIETK